MDHNLHTSRLLLSRGDPLQGSPQATDVTKDTITDEGANELGRRIDSKVRTCSPKTSPPTAGINIRHITPTKRQSHVQNATSKTSLSLNQSASLTAAYSSDDRIYFACNICERVVRRTCRLNWIFDIAGEIDLVESERDEFTTT